MKIITLVENTSVSSEYKSKHGLCFYIETTNHKILFDLGSDKLLLRNAKRLGVDIKAIDTVVISHGHKDHGGALKLFLENNNTAKVYIRENAFMPYYVKVLGIPFYVGLDCSIKDNKQIVLTSEQFIIDEELQLFSGVTERVCYSTANNALFAKTNNGYIQDDFGHEQNLVITENEKCVLFAGCAHNGIVNIQNKAEHLLGKQLFYAISGFHMFFPATNKREYEELIFEIGQRLLKRDTKYYTCHCTGKKAFDLLHNVMGDRIGYLSTGSSVNL